MSNQASPFTQEVKDVIHELSNIYDDIEKKIKDKKMEGAELIDDLKKNVRNMQKRFEEIFENISKQASEKAESAQSTLMEKVHEQVDAVKPFFENMIENIKNPHLKVSEIIDIAGLQIKLAAMYTRIFVKKKAGEIMEKLEDKK